MTPLSKIHVNDVVTSWRTRGLCHIDTQLLQTCNRNDNTQASQFDVHECLTMRGTLCCPRSNARSITSANCLSALLRSVGSGVSWTEVYRVRSRTRGKSSDSFDRALTKLSVESLDQSRNCFGPSKLRLNWRSSRTRMSAPQRVGSVANSNRHTSSSKPSCTRRSNGTE